MNYIICHYSEIGLKKGNRAFFEKQLISNIKEKLAISSVYKIQGRVLIKSSADKELVREKLKSVFGISSFLFCLKVEQKIEEISEAAVKLLEKRDFKSFKVETKRAQKDFPMTSQEISAKVGEVVINQIEGIKASMNEPEVICFIELVGKDAFVSVDKEAGLSGLPVKTGGRALALLSGGIDSPVASFLTMKRGVELVLLHLHTYPETSKASIDKVEELAKILAKYQGKIKLYLVSFNKIQREIFLKVSAKNRVIFYRRAMLKIAQEIAQREGCQAIVTGESLGQVASQTIENIRAIEAGREFLILRPLICKDKEEIISIAKEIGSYEISILPYDDCCSRFIPEYPETRANTDKILEEEKRVGLKEHPLDFTVQEID